LPGEVSYLHAERARDINQCPNRVERPLATLDLRHPALRAEQAHSEPFLGEPQVPAMMGDALADRPVVTEILRHRRSSRTGSDHALGHLDCGARAVPSGDRTLVRLPAASGRYTHGVGAASAS
jgi:hypothetical protein